MRTAEGSKEASGLCINQGSILIDVFVLDLYMNKMDAKMSLKGAHGSNQHEAAASTSKKRVNDVNQCSRQLGQRDDTHEVPPTVTTDGRRCQALLRSA